MSLVWVYMWALCGFSYLCPIQILQMCGHHIGPIWGTSGKCGCPYIAHIHPTWCPDLSHQVPRFSPHITWIQCMHHPDSISTVNEVSAGWLQFFCHKRRKEERKEEKKREHLSKKMNYFIFFSSCKPMLTLNLNQNYLNDGAGLLSVVTLLF